MDKSSYPPEEHHKGNENELTPEEIQDELNGLANGLSDELKLKLDALEVRASDEIRPPEAAWIQEIEGSEAAILGTLGNFSMIIGKAKSRKSFFLNIAVSAVLSEDKLMNQFKGCLAKGKNKVLYFDTEQSRYHVQKALQRICRQIEVEEPQSLKVFGLRSEQPSERLRLIEYAIANTENLGFVVIDGIKDLITSINDEAEATMIASKLLKWTEERNIHIVTVLHQNKGDNNARGHIGTELVNKAETVLSVSKHEKDKDISTVEAEQCRNREPEPFAFRIVEELPTLIEGFEFKQITSREKITLLDLPDYKQRTILHAVFSKGEEFGYGELVRRVKLAAQKALGEKFGDNRVKDFISHCKTEGFLMQDGDKKPYTLAPIVDGLV